MILFPVLQTAPFFSTQSDFLTAGILFAIMIIIIATMVFYSRSNRNFSPNSDARPFSHRIFRREAQDIGLNKKQVKLLELFIKTYTIQHPFRLLSNTRELTVTLRKALHDTKNLSMQALMKEERRLDIYRIKQCVDRASNNRNYLDSTKQLRLGQKITLQQANNKRYPSLVTANLKEFYCAQIPLNHNQEMIRWPKGKKIKGLIWGIDGEEMSIESKILNYTNIKGVSSIILQHSNNINRMSQRRYRRRSLKLSCTLRPVRIMEEKVGKKIKKKAIVSKNTRHIVTMSDISSGGFSLISYKTLPRGELVNLSFQSIIGEEIQVFGKIVGSRHLDTRKIILHVMLTQTSKKHLNRINEYVYDFS